MNYSIPEKQGIKSEWIKEYIEVLEKENLATHNLIIMRNDQIIFEHYWEPFNKDFLHRMYSVSKSFVALAIGFLEQEGKISLDDPIIKYFPEELKDNYDENVRNQTIRHMLMMATAKQCWGWFGARPDDRVAHYFKNNKTSRPAGTIFSYDSSGSFVLCALVERVTGKSFMEYSREKYLDKIGFSKEAYMLKCPGGHSWGDSALICKPVDLLKAAMFCMHKGKWNGEQLLNEEFVVAATSKQIANDEKGTGDHDKQGYGYQFWRTYDNSYFFNGMGGQYAICVPDKNIIMVYNANNFEKVHSKNIVFNNFFDMIVRRAEECVFDDESGYDSLCEYVKTLKLITAKGKINTEIASKINGVTYKMDENPMGITKIKISFNGNKGVLSYTNEQGDKELTFGMCENEYSLFPQAGYSDEIGGQPGNRLYKCAVSAAWVSDYQLLIKVHINDIYFGVLNISIGFVDNKIGVYMVKEAEDFLDEYHGFAGGTASDLN